MSTMTQVRAGRRLRTSVDRDKALLITSSVPVEKAFHFFTDLHKPTGRFATSIFEFAEELKKVDLKSLEFHTKRNDFSKWLKDVIKDDTLSSEFEKVRSLGIEGEKLRSRLVNTVDKRCQELANALKSLAPR
ncbi:MAG TPA: DUF5752 family protein [archaeon]|nr:DUF5752 family protein [archaeon]